MEINTKIDEEIERFLVLLSPYFTLRSSQKALEWLVNRFHIHQFNTDAFIMCILPFHDTNIFVRAIQLIALRNQFGQWYWLRPLQKPGIPLPKNTLLNCCAKDIGLIKLICANLDKATKIHSEKPSVLNVFIAFFTSTIIGMVERSNGVSEEQLAILLPSILNGLVSKFPDLVAGCYMIVAQLNRKANLSPRVAEDLLVSTIKVFLKKKVCSFCLLIDNFSLQGMTPSLALEAVTLLIVLCDRQEKHTFAVSQIQKSFKSLLLSKELLPSIGTLASCYQVSSFISALIQGFVLELGQSAKNLRFKKILTFLTNMIEEVRFIGDDSTVVVK